MTCIIFFLLPLFLTPTDSHNLPDPVDGSCHPNPCPPSYDCYDRKHSEYIVYCKCRAGYVGDGVSLCRPATPPPDPPRNPCIGACGLNARCKVVGGIAACACPAGYQGNPTYR